MNANTPKDDRLAKDIESVENVLGICRQQSAQAQQIAERPAARVEEQRRNLADVEDLQRLMDEHATALAKLVVFDEKMLERTRANSAEARVTFDKHMIGHMILADQLTALEKKISDAAPDVGDLFGFNPN